MRSTPFRTPSGQAVSAVTAEQMRAVDRVAVEEVGLELLQMMENAGRTLAAQVQEVGYDPVIVVAGSGGNGGGGLACARHLANHEVQVGIVLDRNPEELPGAAKTQQEILDEMEIPIGVGTDALEKCHDAAVLVDALIGYGLEGTVRGRARDLVVELNRLETPVVSLDVPSGIDATSGDTDGVAVDPELTLTLALPKTGLTAVSGSLALADIGIPRTVYDRLGIDYAMPFGTRSRVDLE